MNIGQSMFMVNPDAISDHGNFHVSHVSIH